MLTSILIGAATQRIDDDLMNKLLPTPVQHACGGPLRAAVFTNTCFASPGSIAPTPIDVALGP
jgi:hypothetical protein